MYIIDRMRFQKALKDKGYCSIGDLAKKLAIHRNTIHHYLSGSGVFPVNFEKIMSALDLKPAEILIEKTDEQRSSMDEIAPIIDQLQGEFGLVTFVLFGSRASGKSKKYSDWDIGVFAEDELSHDLYRQIVRRADDLIEDLPFFMDVVNLNRADEYFLREASKYWIFLGGSLKGWIALQRKVAA